MFTYPFIFTMIFFTISALEAHLFHASTETCLDQGGMEIELIKPYESLGLLDVVLRV
jgi:hypothetical protein